ncbi:MAG: hypothetical protein K9H06_00435, partial [Melioribacteraceae bacterium]|nr:hypothetical protein [Melioribacteraceae bacterium]
SFETDHEGNLWLGTNVEGLLLLRDRFINTLTEDDGLGVNITYPLFKSRDGGIWVGTNCGGFSKITKEGIKTFRADEQNVINECVWSLYEDDDGTLWIGTFGGGLYKFDGRNFTQYSFNQGMPTNAVFAVMRASDGVLWIGTGNGLCKLVDEEITVYQTDDGLVNNHVNYLAEDDNGSLWISTSGGLSKFSNGEFTNYSQENGFPANSIRFIHFDDDNNLWIGSYGNGLIHYKNNKFTKIDKSNGLFDNVVSTIAEDDFGNFWMTCNKGLFRAEKSELLKFINGETNFINSVFYQKNDGLLSNEFNGGSQPSSLKYPDGTLWLPNLNGVVVVDPAKVNFNSAPPKLFIDKVVIDDSIFVETNSIEFSSSTEKIEISYTALSFSATQNVKFQHKLEGLEKDWSKTTYDRKIIYRLLPPGEYKFKLRACNSDGVWNTEGASINIIVRAMFYETLYFYVGVSILLIIAVWFIYKIRMLNLEKRKSELEIQVNERTASLQKEKEKVEQVLHEVELARKEIENQRDIAERMNQHKTEMMRIVTHNLKNPVGSIKSSVELINSDLDDKEMAEEMLGLIKKAAEEMLDSIQQLLESSKIEDENIKMNFEKVSLIFLIEKLISACEPQVNRKNQTIDFIYDPEKYIEVRADGGKLSAAIENLISNAVKYSPKGKIITVSLNSEPGESVTICVKDEGPGLSEEDKEKVFGKFQKLSAQPTGEESSTGLGLSIVKRIVELHNGKVWVESEAGKGAKFCIHLPTNLN